MSTQVASEVAATPARRPWRIWAVGALGPLTVVCGAVWAILQPYRMTLLHPEGQGFWWLFVQPPLLVILVGALFHLLVARGLIEDMESMGEEVD